MRKSMRLQFHAMPNEIADLLEGLQKEFDFFKGFMTRVPFHLTVFDKICLVDFMGKIPDAGEVVLILSSQNDLQMADGFNRFLDINRDCLLVEVGAHDAKRLVESSLSGMMESDVAMAFSNKVAARIKKITAAGMVAVNPDTGAEANMKNQRHSAGAERFYKQGGRLLPLAGKAYFRIV